MLNLLVPLTETGTLPLSSRRLTFLSLVYPRGEGTGMRNPVRRVAYVGEPDRNVAEALRQVTELITLNERQRDLLNKQRDLLERRSDGMPPARGNGRGAQDRLAAMP